MKKTAIYTPWSYLILPKILVNLVLKYWKPIEDVRYSWNRWMKEFYYITEWETTTKTLDVYNTKEDALKARDDAEALEKYKDMKIELAEVKKERDVIKQEKERIEHFEKENERLRKENEELRNLPPGKFETLKPRGNWYKPETMPKWDIETMIEQNKKGYKLDEKF